MFGQTWYISLAVFRRTFILKCIEKSYRKNTGRDYNFWKGLLKSHNNTFHWRDLWLCLNHKESYSYTWDRDHLYKLDATPHHTHTPTSIWSLLLFYHLTLFCFKSFFFFKFIFKYTFKKNKIIFYFKVIFQKK